MHPGYPGPSSFPQIDPGRAPGLALHGRANSRRSPMSSRSLSTQIRAVGRVVAVLMLCGGIVLGDDRGPKVEERQLPYAMHSQMSERPTIRVGHRDADLIGTDHRALQAAVDYVAALGGVVVEIGAGE